MVNFWLYLITILTTSPLTSLQSDILTKNIDLSTQLKVEKTKVNPTYVVVIDPGHGGKDHGCLYHNHSEKNYTMAIARSLGNQLKYHHTNIKVIYSRSSDDHLYLTKRSHLANQAKADLFISIHLNSHSDQAINGFETFIFGKSDYELNSKYSGSCANSDSKKSDTVVITEQILSQYKAQQRQKINLKIAKAICNAVEETELQNRGIKQAEFLVLKNCKMPSVLLEFGYLTNPNDRSRLSQSSSIKKITEPIAKACLQFLKQTV